MSSTAAFPARNGPHGSYPARLIRAPGGFDLTSPPDCGELPGSVLGGRRGHRSAETGQSVLLRVLGLEEKRTNSFSYLALPVRVPCLETCLRRVVYWTRRQDDLGSVCLWIFV